jgi:hypothetical protein
MRKYMNDKRIEMLENALRNIEFKRDSAITQNDLELVDNFNQQLDSIEAEIKSAEEELMFKSSRFTRPKVRNVSQSSPVMGYAKPVQQQKISNKYHCIVSGEKRMNPCGGCSNPKGCLSSSMQYKEQNS